MKIIINIDKNKIKANKYKIDEQYIIYSILDAITDATDYGKIEENIWNNYEPQETNDNAIEEIAKSVGDAVDIEVAK